MTRISMLAGISLTYFIALNISLKYWSWNNLDNGINKYDETRKQKKKKIDNC